jgi:hypothetical protein
MTDKLENKLIEHTGRILRKLGPGGNSLINGFHSQGPVGDFEGLLMMTWEPVLFVTVHAKKR